MQVIIDRFEGDFAVIELLDKRIINCPKEILPNNAKEGSVLNITVDETATNEKLEKNSERMNKLS